MKNSTKIVFFTLLTVLAGAPVYAEELTAPAATPPEHKAAAVAFVRARAKALEGVDSALKSTRVNGDSTNDSLVRAIEDLKRIYGRNIAAIKTDLPDAGGEAKAAMELLIEIYNENGLSVTGARKSAALMLKAHDDLFRQIEAMQEARSNSLARRQSCEGWATLVTEATKLAVQSRTIELLAGGDAQKVAAALADAMKAVGAKETLAELLDNSVESEIDQIKEFLQQTDPKKVIDQVNKSKKPLYKYESEAWSTYHNRWAAALSGHVRTHEQAYEDFQRAIQKPWLEFYKRYPMALLTEYTQSWEQLAEHQAKIEDQMEAEEKERLEKKREAEDAIDELEDSIKRKTSDIDQVQRHRDVLVEQQEELKAEGGDPGSLDRSIESLDEQIERLQEELAEKNEELEKQKEILEGLE